MWMVRELKTMSVWGRHFLKFVLILVLLDVVATLLIQFCLISKREIIILTLTPSLADMIMTPQHYLDWEKNEAHLVSKSDVQECYLPVLCLITCLGHLLPTSPLIRILQGGMKTNRPPTPAGHEKSICST